MTNTTTRYRIYGRTRLGGLAWIGDGFTLGDAARMLATLNQTSRDHIFHHFLIRPDNEVVGAEAFNASLPGEVYPNASVLVRWFIANGIVDRVGGSGQYMLGGQKFRGMTNLVRQFATPDGKRLVIDRLCYPGMSTREVD